MASIDDSIPRLPPCGCLTCVKCTASDPSVVEYNSTLLALTHSLLSDLNKDKKVDDRMKNTTCIGRGWRMSNKRRTIEMEDVMNVPKEDIVIDEEIEADNLARDNLRILWRDLTSPIIEKTFIKTREVLLHYELTQSISDEGEFKEMIPRFIRADLCIDNLYSIKMECISGDILHKRWSKLDPVTQKHTLVVIHHFLSFAYNKNRFTHGDLSTSNIIIRTKKGKLWSWSISTGTGSTTITLPFCPTFIDFEYSSSHSHSYYDSFSSPYRNESADILRLYGLLLRYFSDDQEPLKTVKEHLEPILGDWWFGCEDDDQYIPVSVPLLHPLLTHKALIDVLMN